MELFSGLFIKIITERNSFIGHDEDFEIVFESLSVQEAPAIVFNPTLKLYKNNPTLKMDSATSRLMLYDGDTLIKTWSYNSSQVLIFQGMISSISTEGLSLIGAQEIDVTYLSMNFKNIIGCRLFLNGEEVIEDAEILSLEEYTEKLEFEVVKNAGFTYANKFIQIKQDLNMYGYDEPFVDVPYEYDTFTNKLIVYLACLVDASYPATSGYIELYEPREKEGYHVELEKDQIQITDGFVLKEEMNETLDSGTVKFVSKITETDIEQFDEITFENDDLNFTRKKLLVDTFDTNIVEYNESDIFQSQIEYTVSLFSETKILERCPCPNLTITRRANNPKTVYQKVLEYCHLYLPRVNIYDLDNGVESHCCLKVDPELQNYLNIECPELHWNNPTLREVLNDLFSVANLIPIVKDNVLTFLDLHRRGNEINTLKISDFKLSGVSSDYCDELYVPISNVIQEGKTVVCEYSAAKAESERFGDSNIIFETSKPINRIISVKVYTKLRERRSGVDNSHLAVYDITDYVIEKSAYDAKSPQDFFESRSDLIKDFNLFNLYFVRGERSIRHITDSTYFQFGSSGGNYSKINLVIAALICRSSGGSAGTGSESVVDVRPNVYTIENGTDCFCLIEYEAIDETTVSFGKTTPIKNQNNRLFDGQSSSIVDIKKQAQQEYSKIDRFGNKILDIYGSFTNESDVPQLSDTIGEWVLFSRELQYYDDIILFSGKLCKNYVLQNYFTGILNEKRIFQLIQNKEATTRHENIKFYVAVCLDKDKTDSDHNAAALGVYQITNNINVISRTLQPYGTEPVTDYIINHCFFQNDEIKTKYADSDTEFAMDTNYGILGRSFVIDTGFYDNVLAGNGVAKESDGSKYAIPYHYTDDNGEFSDVYIDLVNKYEPADEEFDFQSAINSLKPVVENDDFDNTTYNMILDKTREKPKVRKQGIDISKMHLVVSGNHVYKDNSERMKFTVQFEFFSGSEEVFIKDSFLETLRWYTLNKKSYNVYIAKNNKYTAIDNFAKGMLRADISLTFNNVTALKQDYVQLVGDTSDLTFNDCWCIADENGRVLLAVNGNYTKINFELRANIDSNVYNNIIDREKIGKLNEDSLSLEQSLDYHPAKIKFITAMGRIIDVNNTLDVDAELEKF